MPSPDQRFDYGGQPALLTYLAKAGGESVAATRSLIVLEMKRLAAVRTQHYKTSPERVFENNAAIYVVVQAPYWIEPNFLREHVVTPLSGPA